jgi:Flp pilus assembly protein TadG
MRTFLIIALILLLAAVFLNDVGHYARAKYNLDVATTTIVNEVSRYGVNRTRNLAAIKAAAIGRSKGVEVYQYDQDDVGIRVWTRVPVSGTLVVGPFLAWRAHKPLDSPFMVMDYRTSVFQ